MGKGTGSGKGSGKGDAASTIGKALTCVSGVTIFMGFIALIIAAAVISRTVDEAKMKACGNDPESYQYDCARMGYNSRRLVSSGSVTAADSSDSFHMRFAHDVVASVDKQIHKAGQRQRKLTHSSPYSYDNCGLTQSQMCQPATLTTQEEEDAISGIRMYAMISGALASIGALPALAGGIAKTLGKQGLSDGCGMLALCSTCFLSCCGALAFAAIPFTFAAIISTLCTQWESDLERFESEGGSSSCTGECLEALKDIAGGWCGLSGSILVSTIIAILAALFGVLTTILTVVGFTQRKKTAPQQTVVVVQQNAAPAPAAVVPVAATATVVDKN